MSALLLSDPRLPASSVPVAPMHSLSQADATIKELRKRIGDDLGLLFYLLDDEVRTAPFDDKAESSGYLLPI